MDTQIPVTLGFCENSCEYSWTNFSVYMFPLWGFIVESLCNILSDYQTAIKVPI